MNDFNKKIHYILWIYRHRYVKGIYYQGRYTIEEYGIYNNKFKEFQELKEMKTFKNKCELKLYLALKGIKFNNFKIYDYLTARMINFYDE